MASHDVCDVTLAKLKQTRSKLEVNLKHKYFHLLQSYVLLTRLRRIRRDLLNEVHESRLTKRFFVRLSRESIAGNELRKCCRLVKAMKFTGLAEFMKFAKVVFPNLGAYEIKLVFVENFAQSKLMGRIFDRLKTHKQPNYQ